MKKIPLTNSRRKAKIDDEDYPLISRFRWRLQSGNSVLAFLPGGQLVRSDDKVVANIGGQIVGMGMLVMFPELAQEADSAN